ncbi:MAG: zf-TFIIB domain-containing protein [Halobacteriales archaeon]
MECPACSTELESVSNEKVRHWYCPECYPEYEIADPTLMTSVLVFVGMTIAMIVVVVLRDVLRLVNWNS